MSYDPDSEGWPDIIVCHRCRKRVVQGLSARYEHDECDPAEDDAARRRESQRQLFLRTARLMRKMGFPSEAPWHEERAR